MSPLKFTAALGQQFLIACQRVGQLAIFILHIIINLPTFPYYLKNIKYELIQNLIGSLVLVGVTALFTGIVMTVHTLQGMGDFNSYYLVPEVVTISVVRELAPVILALMVAGRIGSSIAAEIGSMRISDQLDALVTLSVNPMRYLIVPKAIALALVLPFLTIVADFVAIAGSLITTTYKTQLSAESYLYGVRQFLSSHDIYISTIKSILFGFIISSTGCYYGYNCRFGAEGVGEATTRAVAFASLLILFINGFFTILY